MTRCIGEPGMDWLFCEAESLALFLLLSSIILYCAGIIPGGTSLEWESHYGYSD